MKKIDWRTVSFVSTGAKKENFPSFPLIKGKMCPEIVIGGKSNVGKSSLINTLFGRKSVAHTSKTPGKTKAIHFFLLPEVSSFADLPGYGWAKVSRDLKDKWNEMMEEYFETRKEVVCTLILIDSRHPPSKEDRLFAEWLNFHKKKALLVLTKSDKISKEEKKKWLASHLSSLFPEGVDYLFFSSKTKESLLELRMKLSEVICQNC